MESKADARAFFALACVCLFWGTTYLGIRMALESFPPAMLVAVRFLISGSLLLGFALTRGHAWPEKAEMRRTALLGVLILGMGNGSLGYAELIIPSGLASLFITISPFWLVGIEAMLPAGAKLHGPTVIGMFVGFAGTALLITPDFHGQNGGLTALTGFAITQFGVVCWCSGSILQKRSVTKASPWMTLGLQQFAAGLAFVPPAILMPAQPVHLTTRGVGAILYLVIFGSLVGYTAYFYAINKLPIAVFSVYPYVNSVVAVFLGWLFYREAFGLKEMFAMLIIFTGVGIVKWQTSRAAIIRHPSVEEVLEPDHG
jgi:drug/metabolite transporter (DMT)-like permease